MDAALESGASYLDLVTNRDIFQEQLDRDSEFRKSDLTAILGLGITPGISNLLAKKGANELDSVGSIYFRTYGSGGAGDTEYKNFPFISMFSPKTFIQEWVEEPALVYRNNKFMELPHFSGEEEWELPKSLGITTLYNCYHDEVETIPRNADLLKEPSTVEYKYALSQKAKNALLVLRQIGLTSEKPVEIMGKKVVPIDLVSRLLPDPHDLVGKVKYSGCMSIEVNGTKKGKKTSYTYTIVISPEDHEQIYENYGTTSTGLMTGLPLAIGTELLLKREIDASGVKTPECLIPDSFLKKFRSEIPNIKIYKEVLTRYSMN
jgi:saccharopine dehydrogenase (NAD+, L-lysine-forming)